jgi:hypothetical protein
MTERMSFTFAKSLRCFLCFSVIVWDGPDRREVDGDACNPRIDEACTPVDMTFSSMRSIRISLTDFYTALRSLNIHTQYQISRVGEQTLKVSRTGGEVSIRTARKQLVLCGLR